MRQEWEKDEHVVQRWNRWSNPYPTHPPVEEVLTDAVSNDLVISQSNSERYGGGPFHVVKRSFRESSTLGSEPVLLRGSGSNNKYAALVKPRARRDPVTVSAFPVVSPSSDALLKSMGREAIGKTAPTQSEFDAAQALGEIISDGVPGMLGLSSRKRDIAGRSADEYLNYTFGIKPFLNDVRSAVNAYQNSDKIWNDYVRRSGKRSQRRYDFPTETTTEMQTLGNYTPVPALDSNLRGTPQLTPLTRQISTVTKRWFSADYTYYVPTDPFGRNRSRWEKLYGVMPGIDTVWELTPWSWAADWFGDLGTLTENLEILGKDGLVMENAFIMEHKSVTHEYVLHDVTFKSFPAKQTLMQSFKTETKYRLPASPYGFYLEWADFSASQLSILAALGISKRSGARF